MGTLNKRSVWEGYCPIDKNIVTIEVGYVSLTIPGEKTIYFKNRNNCCYIREHKCSKDTDCPIYIDAPEKKTEDQL